MLFSKTDDLNWSVKKEGLITTSGIELKNDVAIVREDTNKVLSVMGKDYQAYQNSELIELLERVAKTTGMPVKRSGSFGEGEKVYIQLKSNDLKLGNDRIEGYLTGINSFDGSTSLAFGPTNTTISCTNTFFAAFRDMSTKVRHSKSMVVKIDDICKGLDSLLIEEKKIFDKIVKMSESPYDVMLKEKITRQLFDIKPEFGLDSDDLSTQMKNKLSSFEVDMNGELTEKGNNLWGLFSGVTKYTTHHLSDKDNTKAKMFGIYGKRELKIFNELAELV